MERGMATAMEMGTEEPGMETGLEMGTETERERELKTEMATVRERLWDCRCHRRTR
jgi:hypothetical protein